MVAFGLMASRPSRDVIKHDECDQTVIYKFLGHYESPYVQEELYFFFLRLVLLSASLYFSSFSYSPSPSAISFFYVIFGNFRMIGNVVRVQVSKEGANCRKFKGTTFLEV